MSILTYNTVPLSMVKTLGVEQRPTYDPSNTDVLWFTYTLRTESIFSVGTAVFGGDSFVPFGLPDLEAGETSPHEIMARLRHMLLQPRKPLLFQAGSGLPGEFLLDVSGGLDANNGPKPLRCDIAQLTETTFRVLWDVEVSLADCDNTAQRFASNRWEQTHDIDAKGFSTLTTTGELVVRSDMRVNPDQLRGLVAPPLGNDFVREASYQLDRSGLKLQYRFRDVQKYILPPDGCTVVDGDTAITGTHDGGVLTGSVRVVLEGLKGEKPRNLMATACLMAFRKLESLKPVERNGGAVVLSQCGYRQWHADNRVEVTLTAMLRTTPFVSGTTPALEFGKGVANGVKDVVTGDLADIAVHAAIVANEELMEAADPEEAARAVALDQQLREARERLAQRMKDGGPPVGLAQAPPWDRFGDDLAFTDQDVPGLDPGLRGNVPFLQMVAAAFRDPCTRDVVARPLAAVKPAVPQKAGSLSHKPGGGGDTVIAGVAGAAAQAAITGALQAVNAQVAQQNLSYTAAQEEDIAANLKALKNERVAGRRSRLRTFVIVDDLTLMTPPIGLAGADPYPGVYTSWFCTVKVRHEPNVRVCRRTVEGLPGVPIRWANPGATVFVRWSAEKSGAPPEFPVCIDPNLIMVGFEVEAEDVAIAADGVTRVYRMAGESVYEALDPAKVAARPAAPPWMFAVQRAQPGPIPRVLDLSNDATSSSLTTETVIDGSAGGAARRLSTPGVTAPTTGGGSITSTSMSTPSRVTTVPGVSPVNP